MDQAFDWFARVSRPFFFAAALLALPVFFVSYLYCLRLLFDAVPMWAFVIASLSHIIVWIGASMLHDYRQERRSQQ